MNKVGFTTSIPVEVIFAAGLVPVDLNNIFISGSNPEACLENAENEGFPRSTCAWIKGIYSSVLDVPDIQTIIGVVEGDCSNTRALIEVLEMKGIYSIPFSYPLKRDYESLEHEIKKLCSEFHVSMKACLEIKKELDKIRKKLAYLDELTWKYHKATGYENHFWQVSSSDFFGDYKEFELRLDQAIQAIENRHVLNQQVRLGYIGVPPIHSDLYGFIETLNARIVFNEVQRQFTMTDQIGNDDLVETYLNFTYPYSLNLRLADIKKQIQLRRLDGIIHYTQAFCFRGIEDIVMRKELNVPVLTLEGDRPGNLDARTKLRLESLIDMLE